LGEELGQELGKELDEGFSSGLSKGFPKGLDEGLGDDLHQRFREDSSRGSANPKPKAQRPDGRPTAFNTGPLDHQPLEHWPARFLPLSAA
jgi:hypothetical protein